MPQKVTQTIQIPLKEPSNRKKELIDKNTKRQGEIAEKITELMPSIPPSRWSGSRTDSVFHRWVNKFFPENNGLRSHDANQVAYKVAQNFETYKSNGYRGKKPSYDSDSFNVARFCNCSGNNIVYEENDNKWGVKLPLKPYKPEWFRLKVGEYQEKILKRQKENGVKLGDSELKKEKDGYYILNQAITFEVEEPSYEPKHYIGVDVGLNNVATATVLDNEGKVKEVEFWSGNRIKHYRNRYSKLREELQRNNQTLKLKELKVSKNRFYNQKNHEISRQIIDLANKYKYSVIVMEELKDIKSSINDFDDKDLKRQLSSWSHGELQKQITYKANKEVVRTKKVDAAYTSKKCNKCGEIGERPYKRNHDLFYCSSCDYEVNADFNGAVNIAKEAMVST